MNPLNHWYAEVPSLPAVPMDALNFKFEIVFFKGSKNDSSDSLQPNDMDGNKPYSLPGANLEDPSYLYVDSKKYLDL
ncbi:MAG: hypothetical protein TRG1_3244 [Flavobacteriaceae bacterium FS1-H7996/R]|nr:MAG: hypothetical protein TRG1_3244 [Flavobacteriaceae bacterium FS1-H7996/R]